MKKFLSKTLIFIGVFLLVSLIVALFVGATHKFIPHHKFYNHEFEKAFKDRDIEFLAIGNSKLLASLDKGVIEKELGYKTAILGCMFSNMSVTKLSLQSYLNKCTEYPKVVLMEVSWFAFNTKRTDVNDVAGTLVLNDLSLWREAVNYYPKLNDPIKRSIVKQLLHKVRPTNPVDYAVEFTEKTPNIKDYKWNQTEFEKVFPDHIAGVDPFLLQEYKAIVKMCKDNNIKLVLYTAPEATEYASLQTDAEVVKNQFKNTKDAIYLDYTIGGDLFKKDYELWLRDSHHLNENDLFTEVLVSDIKASIKISDLIN